MLDYTSPLSVEESTFAEKHHNMVVSYLRTQVTAEMKDIKCRILRFRTEKNIATAA